MLGELNWGCGEAGVSLGDGELGEKTAFQKERGGAEGLLKS